MALSSNAFAILFKPSLNDFFIIPFKIGFSIKKSATNVTSSLPIIAEGTRLIFLADLIITAPAAKPAAQTNPKKFPKTSPFSKESLKI